MSPYEIKLILHWHCVCDEFPHKNAPIYPQTMANMINDGLIKRRDDGLYITTDRGAKFVEMLCSTPLPVDGGWVDPRFVRAPND